MINRTGRVGHACARAKVESAGSTAAPAPRCRTLRRETFIDASPTMTFSDRRKGPDTGVRLHYPVPRSRQNSCATIVRGLKRAERSAIAPLRLDHGDGSSDGADRRVHPARAAAGLHRSLAAEQNRSRLADRYFLRDRKSTRLN